MGVPLEYAPKPQLQLSLLLLLILSNLVSQPVALARAEGETEKQPKSNSSRLAEHINLNEADQNGIYLLGLFDVHLSSARSPLKCGQLDVDAGESSSRRSMQNLQAFLWAIEQVNADESLLPGVRLGSLAMDTCSSFLRTNQQLANLLHSASMSAAPTLPADPELADSARNLPRARQFAAIIADNADWQSVEAVASMSSALGLTTFVTQTRSSRLAQLARRAPQRLRKRSANDQLDSLLAEVLADAGVGRQMQQPTGGLADVLDELEAEQSQLEARWTSSQPELLMVRMQPNNELLAETIASLLAHLGWDLVSVVYDEQADMVDLHDELAKQLFARNIQLALDEQLAAGWSAANYERLLAKLALKSAGMGARVVLSLVGTSSARQLLDTLHLMRSRGPNGSLGAPVEQLNSLLWLTVADREPYYARATDALGTISVSSSASLLAEFKLHYDHLAAGEQPTNRWWSEYVRSVLLRHQKELSLLASECAKWSEPRASTLKVKCRSLTLARLVEAERTLAGQQSAGQSAELQQQPRRPKQTGGRLAKYLAGGWEHNGMEVINAVLATANALESLRQSLCPESVVGLCDKMRLLLKSQPEEVSTVEAANSSSSPLELPTLSELMHAELQRSTFPLADGRMFGLDESADSTASGQLDFKIKLYNLRYLQANSIGFVKFATYDQHDGLLANASKAQFYPTSNSYADQTPVSRLRSSCQDERKCLILSGLLASSDSPNSTGIGEEELAAKMNSLFKLDHPLISGQPGAEHSASGQTNSSTGSSAPVAPEEPQVRSMRSPFALLNVKHLSANWTSPGSRQRFNLILLLPLHRANDQSSSARVDRADRLDRRCSEQLAPARWFQLLAAVGHAQDQANSARQQLARQTSDAESGQQIELTTTVIDYCEQNELALNKLAKQLNSAANSALGQPIGVLDFGSVSANSIEQPVNELLAELKSPMLHLTVGGQVDSTATSTLDKQAAPAKSRKTQRQLQQLHISLTPSKADEIQALVQLIAQMPNWRLVHLVYTDRHHYRDEFVRRANELNICVSKLIWIPPMGADDYEQLGEQANRSALSAKTRQLQLEKTRKLFQRELFDHSSSAADKQADLSGAEGLRDTRVLVVLASEQQATNRLILEASSASMLNDYVWLTSHEWLESVEMAAEASELADDHQPTKLPRLFVSTRLETYESHSFRNFLAQLSPAIHSPIPTDWFDQFWQQHFHCRLPMATNSLQSAGQPTCQPNERLDVRTVPEDDRVHYTIETVLALQSALLELSDRHQLDFEALARRFRAQLQARAATRSTFANQQPYGFHLLHRLLPVGHQQQSRRPNSRSLIQGELVRVGLWRSNQLQLEGANSSRPLWSSQANKADENGESDSRLRAGRSLGQLAEVKSRCSVALTCSLCRKQIEQTMLLIGQERARLGQSASLSEPKAISSMWTTLLAGNSRRRPQSILDSAPSSAFDEQPSDEPPKDRQLEASASSLFDSNTSRQLERQQRADTKRLVSQWPSISSGDHKSLQRAIGMLMSLLSLVGVVCLVASMTYLYPSLLDRKTSSRRQEPQNMNDYILLTGLLMLFSINVAFLLPATPSVCWLRRIGLATSYSLIFSSILVKALASNRQRSAGRSASEQATQTTVHPQTANRTLDPIEDGVELTFESLPHESTTTEEPSAPSTATTTTTPSTGQLSSQPDIYLSNGYQTDPLAHMHTNETQPDSVGCSSAALVSLSSGLIVGQLLLELIWLARQPVEPTLYMSCWHCASPNRSPLLYLYEPLLNLTYPAIILVIGWLCSAVAYSRCRTHLADYECAVTHLLASASLHPAQQLQQPHARQEILNRRLRDAKSLLISTSLLATTWTCLLLNLISWSAKLIDKSADLVDSARLASDLSLVYANITSGAIIFAILFIYRLRLFASRSCFSSHRPKGSFVGGMAFGGSRRNVLKVNQTAAMSEANRLQFNGQRGNAIGMQTADTHLYQVAYPVAFTGSQFWAEQVNSGHQERLRLHHLSTYGTYSVMGEQPAEQSAVRRMSATLKGPKRRNKLLPGLFGNGGQSSAKLQRRQSAGSIASSTAKLVRDKQDDSISCTSVASSSTSQLQGNELYPIDCSIQLDAPTLVESGKE